MTITVISLFAALALHQHLMMGQRLREWLKIDDMKPVKILDCFPCWAFWIAVLVTIIIFFIDHGLYAAPYEIKSINPIPAMATFVIAHILQR